MKKIALAASLIFPLMTGSHFVQAADPVWLEGKNDQVYSIKVYHSPSCGCCKGWIEHLEDHDFKVESIEMNDVNPIKQQYGVPQEGASCHTAVVNGKVIEGHVPAQDIKTLLASQNNIHLLTVPGMPSGGPGMDFAGARKDDFSVYAMDKNGKVSTYNRYEDY
ncbi:DUF411 domain-containing protein [Oceanospirillum sp. HFRX-1_2]